MSSATRCAKRACGITTIASLVARSAHTTARWCVRLCARAGSIRQDVGQGTLSLQCHVVLVIICVLVCIVGALHATCVCSPRTPSLTTPPFAAACVAVCRRGINTIRIRAARWTRPVRSPQTSARTFAGTRATQSEVALAKVAVVAATAPAVVAVVHCADSHPSPVAQLRVVFAPNAAVMMLATRAECKEAFYLFFKSLKETDTISDAEVDTLMARFDSGAWCACALPAMPPPRRRPLPPPPSSSSGLRSSLTTVSAMM